ncbi:MAG: FAD:protein FMN transferase, partial [Bacteroidota bacterium]
TVLHFARRLARRSKGAFDPTVGPLTKLWRRAFRLQTFPARERILAARARVQWQDLKTASNDRVRLRRNGMQLDLGGVAKGYALDAVGEQLRQNGYRSYLIDGGGDLLLGEPPPGKPGWSVVTPTGENLGELSEVAIATSGATYRYLERDGVRYSHLIDPRTGYGVTGHELVTVIAPTGMVADALASTLSISGDDAKLCRRYGASRKTIPAPK